MSLIVKPAILEVRFYVSYVTAASQIDNFLLEISNSTVPVTMLVFFCRLMYIKLEMRDRA